MADLAPTQLALPDGVLELQRYPARPRETLQAWCGADLLLIEAARAAGFASEQVLVVNDEHGALGTALSPAAVWTDSALAATALANNLKRNGRAPVPVCWSTGTPPGSPRYVLLRLPKNQAFLDYQLAVLQAVMPAGATLLCAGMDKHLPATTAELIAQRFAAVERHPGRRKAHLYSALRDERPVQAPPPRPRYHCDPLGAELVGGANVFSSRQLDIGSRFLIEQLSRLQAVQDAADLACGVGVLGLAALAAGIAGSMLFADESAMAVEAARDNHSALCGDRENARFYHGDGLPGAEKFDLVLCNPPFHLGHTVDDFAGRRLLADAARKLRPGGALCVVANRHLPYARLLRRRFDTVEQLASNRKFCVWLARAAC